VSNSICLLSLVDTCFWHEEPNRVRRLREGVESRPQGLPGDRPEGDLGEPGGPQLKGHLDEGQRGPEARINLPGEHHQLPRGDEEDRRSEGRGEDWEGRPSLGLQPGDERSRV